MNLTFLTTGKEPSNDMKRLFDKTRVIQLEERGIHRRVPEVEKLMADEGSRPFDFDDFVIGTSDLEDLTYVIGRNRFNLGIADLCGDRVPVGKSKIKPQVYMADTELRIVNSLSTPYKGRHSVLFFPPHYEEDMLALIGMQKSRGDNIFADFICAPPKQSEMYSRHVYEDVLKISECSEYSFMGIEDKGVIDNEGKIRSMMKKRIEEFEPDTIVMNPKGGNYDHGKALEIALPLAKDYDVNLILSEVVQDALLRPNIWSVADGSEIEKFACVYNDPCFGGPHYSHAMKNLFRKNPEPLNRYVSELRAYKSLNHEVGGFGMQAVILKGGYQIPHATNLFPAFQNL